VQTSGEVHAFCLHRRGLTAGRCHGLIAPRHTLGRNRFKAQRHWQKVTAESGPLREVHLAAIASFQREQEFEGFSEILLSQTSEQ
jgi:hypothetical protein